MDLPLFLCGGTGGGSLPFGGMGGGNGPVLFAGLKPDCPDKELLFSIYNLFIKYINQIPFIFVELSI
jgi:hypothetical protein